VFTLRLAGQFLAGPAESGRRLPAPGDGGFACLTSLAETLTTLKEIPGYERGLSGTLYSCQAPANRTVLCKPHPDGVLRAF